MSGINKSCEAAKIRGHMKLVEVAGSVALVVSLILAIWFAFATKEEARNVALAATVVFICGTVFLHRRIRCVSQTEADPDASVQHGLTRFSRDLEITYLRRNEIEVIYPKKFKSRPNLVVSLLHGDMELTFIEQRPDGFRLKTGSGTWGRRTVATMDG
jgi:hypothetical protein